MDTQINFPEDWHIGHLVPGGLNFSPDAVHTVDETQSRVVAIYNESQIRTIGGGWALKQTHNRFYLYSREQAGCCRRCVDRKTDRLFLMRNVEMVEFEARGDDTSGCYTGKEWNIEAMVQATLISDR